MKLFLGALSALLGFGSLSHALNTWVWAHDFETSLKVAGWTNTIQLPATLVFYALLAVWFARQRRAGAPA